MTTRRRCGSIAAALAFLVPLIVSGATHEAFAQQRKFSFAHVLAKTTGYGLAYSIFNAKLSELSGGKFTVDEFPSAQLGQEEVLVQKVRSGDIDFAITSSANRRRLSNLAWSGSVSGPTS